MPCDGGDALSNGFSLWGSAEFKVAGFHKCFFYSEQKKGGEAIFLPNDLAATFKKKTNKKNFVALRSPCFGWKN